MKPIGSRAVGKLVRGKKLGFSSPKGEDFVVAEAEFEAQSTQQRAVVRIVKVYYQSEENSPQIVPGEEYFTDGDHLYESTKVCSECKGSCQARYGQEALGFTQTCRHCGGIGLEPSG